ncbi:MULTISPECIES: TlpA disulfide reductase family protein [Rhodomicrobium]|uniref:TlpA disulfide reductase family protein n=1 Tax=Rhodomicrobium TaxID=1068 RepID=UPI000B4BA8E6|nr:MULTISPECIES: TlpA disulfide reductase family protein [Rhodomicrobium]
MRASPARRIGRIALISGLAAFSVSLASRAETGLNPAAEDTQALSNNQLQPWTEGNKPPLRLPVLDGATADLADHAGKTVLVHFFATYCAPCRPELASLARLAERRAGRPFTILAIDVGEVPDRVRRFLSTAPVPFPVLLDGDRSVTKSWGVYGLPTTFVLDAKLTPRLYVEGDLDWMRADILAKLDGVAASATD